MKIKLTAVGQIYSEDEARKLLPLGFEFTRLNSYTSIVHLNGSTHVQLSSMKELLEFAKLWGDVIISGDPPELRLYNAK